MGVTVILPSIDLENTRACIDTMRFVDPASVPILTGTDAHGDPDIASVNGVDWHDGRPAVRLVVVYNTLVHNLGVAGSWNVGVREMYEHHHDWLVICSAGVRFGEAGGTDFLWALDFQREPWPSYGIGAIEAGNDFGWLQTRGIASILTSGTVLLGAEVIVPSLAAGSINAALVTELGTTQSSEVTVGQVQRVAATAAWSTIFLCIDG